MKCFSKILFIIVDGARFDIFSDLLEKGRLPAIKKYVAERGCFLRARTVFPSVSGPACLAMWTGKHPAVLGIPGLRWMDREIFRRFPLHPFAFRSYVGPGISMMKKDISPTKSLFTVFRKNSAIFPMAEMKGLKNVTAKIQMGVTLTARLSRVWKIADDIAGMFLVREVSRGVQLVVCTFPGIDELAHLLTPFHGKVIEEYERVDRWIGKAMKIMEGKGILDETLIVVTSDHGLSETATHIDLDSIAERQLGGVLAYPKLTPGRIFKPHCAVMTSGNAMSHVYFKGKNGWGERVCLEEMKRLYGRLLDELEKMEGISMLVAKGENGRIYRFKPQQNSWVEMDENDFLYDEIEPVFKCNRSGDLIVIARNGYDLRAKWFEIPPHRASHGGIDDEHMNIPLALSFPAPPHLSTPPSTLDLFPALLSALRSPLLPELI